MTINKNNRDQGYVYIVSNIGSFGAGVFKIGMTRRLDPMKRIRELNSASVPFPFDTHAVIYCDDAPALEKYLHKKFEHKSMNLASLRKEFFRISLGEIEQVFIDAKWHVVFSKGTMAEQYKKTLVIQEINLSN